MTESQQWVAGIHAVTELIQQHAADISRLLVQQGRDDQRMASLLEMARSVGLRIETVPRPELDKLAGKAHQGVAAECRFEDQLQNEKTLEKLLDTSTADPLLLVLDEITDPHNFGACLRSADAAGVTAVIVPKHNTAPVNLTVRKVASGAAETVPIIAVSNLARCLKSLQERGIWLVGTADSATVTLYQQDLTGPLALVMGSEGKGLRRLTRESCDYLVAIPMAGSVASLNVSVATGICLFEAVRQRQGKRSG